VDGEIPAAGLPVDQAARPDSIGRIMDCPSMCRVLGASSWALALLSHQPCIISRAAAPAVSWRNSVGSCSTPWNAMRKASDMSWLLVAFVCGYALDYTLGDLHQVRPGHAAWWSAHWAAMLFPVQPRPAVFPRGRKPSGAGGVCHWLLGRHLFRRAEAAMQILIYHGKYGDEYWAGRHAHTAGSGAAQSCSRNLTSGAATETTKNHRRGPRGDIRATCWAARNSP